MSDGKNPFEPALNLSELKKLYEPQMPTFADQLKKMAEEMRAPPMELPRYEPIVPRFETPKEINEFQSAGLMVKSMARTVRQWRLSVPADTQPVVLAVLQGGIQVNVTMLAEESFHVLRVEGTIDGNPCMLLTHQASVQLLCMVVKVEDESRRRSIGFIIDGQETQA